VGAILQLVTDRRFLVTLSRGVASKPGYPPLDFGFECYRYDLTKNGKHLNGDPTVIS
jgi:hypothetical protein